MYSSVTVSGLVAKLKLLCCNTYIRWIRRPILKEKLQSYVPVDHGDRLSFHWWMLLQSNQPNVFRILLSLKKLFLAVAMW